jgi:hypothetical protein
MQIVVTRVDAHRYSTIVERDDGVRLRVPGYGFMRALPHDLAHCVVEERLGLDRGFWGSVADGAEFGGMERLEGRRKPHAAVRAQAISKSNVDYLGEAERLVACFEKIVEGNLDLVPQLAGAQLREASATVRHRERRITQSDVAKVCAAWRTMQARWHDLPIGQSICVEWHCKGACGRHAARKLRR